MRIGNIELQDGDLATHIRIMGGSGMGKSTLLYDLLMQLIMEDEGFALLDPHGELYGQLLSFLTYTDHRQDEVHLIDATRRDTTATVNPFTSAPDQETIQTKAQILADLTVQVWGKESEAVRADKILYILYVALLEQGRPLSDILDVLAHPGEIRDAFARSEWAKIKPTSLDSVMTRLHPLTHDRLKALTDPGQALDFNRLLDSKILLANLSRSDIMGQRECRTLSAFLVAEIWSAVFSRRKRHPAFYLVIDEFALLATPELASVLTQAQKFGLHLIFLHQDTQQLPAYIRDAIGNVSCFIQFLGKGKVLVRGWESGDQVTWLDPERVPEVDDEYLEEYRVAVTIPAVSKPLPAPSAPMLELPKEPGKGGDEHKHLQSFIAAVGETLAFKATIEKSVPGGHIDVLLERKDLSVACEVSVRSTIEQEQKNVHKCLAAGYDNVIVLVTDPKRIPAISSKLPGVQVVPQTGLLAALKFFMDRNKPKSDRVDSKEACEILGGINLSTLYRRVKRDGIPFYQPGGPKSPYLFDRAVLVELGKSGTPKAKVKMPPLRIDKTRPAKKEKQDEFFRKELYGE